MTVYGVGAAFGASWDNSGDFLARVGLRWDQTEIYDQYGTISADYNYTKTGDGGDFSYIGIHGWSVDPLIEYYIVDDWFGAGPPTGGGSFVGSFQVDGGIYDIYYKDMQIIAGSIPAAMMTFTRFMSVRQAPRQCGHISITAHFDKWDSLGLTLGRMNDCRLFCEAGGGQGSIDYTYGTVTATGK
jgi:hypothetical protein